MEEVIADNVVENTTECPVSEVGIEALHEEVKNISNGVFHQESNGVFHQESNGVFHQESNGVFHQESNAIDVSNPEVTKIEISNGVFHQESNEPVVEELSKKVSKIEISNEFQHTSSETMISEEDSKDCEVNEKNEAKEIEFKPPGDNLVEKIIRETESYFVNFNLFKNSFLLKHIQRNREGYVSLRLVASFRKLKSITKDWRVVGYSLERSNKLQLNEEKTKIRRIEPIPKIEETSFGKTVVVFNISPQNLPSVQLKEIFSKFGTVIHFDILKTGSKNCNAYHKRCINYNHEIASNVFCVVEFETFEEALRAIKDEEGYLPKENRMKVVPLMSQIYGKDRSVLRGRKSVQYWRRANERFKQRIESLEAQLAAPKDDEFDIRKNKGFAQNILREDNNFRRGGYYRRSYRGKKFGTNNLVQQKGKEGDYYNEENLVTVEAFQSRQLRTNNSMNINAHFTREPVCPSCNESRLSEA